MGISFKDLYPFLLVLARFGPAFSMLPGFRGGFVSPRIRLLFALGFAYLLSFPMISKVPPIPPSQVALILLFLQEVFTGIFIGLLVRLIFYTLEMAGQILSMQVGLAAAQLFNPAMETQSGVMSSFLTMVGLILIFTTDLYQMILGSLVHSYSFFGFSQPLPVGDMTSAFVDFVNSSFKQAVLLCIPVLVVILSFFVGVGLISRFIPGVQVFFIILPVQVMLALLVLFFVITGVYEVYIHYFSDQLSKIPTT